MTWCEIGECVINTRDMVSAEEDETAYTERETWKKLPEASQSKVWNVAGS